MIQSNKHYSHTWVGDHLNNDTTRQFIADCRNVLYDTEFRLVVRGRNPDRQQFQCYTPVPLRRSIPKKWATYFGLYLRRKDEKGVLMDRGVWEAHGRIQAIKAIYRNSLIFP